MAESDESNPMLRAIELNAKRRVVRYAELRAEGASWMLECRDLWDSEDEDAGVYFAGCADGREVGEFIRGMDRSSDRLLGIYDLSKPLAGQGPGLTLQEWLAR